MKHVLPFEDTINENRDVKLSQFILANLNDLKSKLHYYDGNFKFLKSVKAQYKSKGYLTETQWQAVYRCFYN
tara:strand:+ start:3832 stop:4047 length:216 start_codon:yes stop_codon:yes gene_type:complete